MSEMASKRSAVGVMAAIALILVVSTVDQTEQTTSTLVAVSQKVGKSAESAGKAKSGVQSIYELTEDLKHELSHLDECVVAPIPQLDLPNNFRPFWMPAYPSSGGDVVSALVRGITGMRNPSKNYHASSKGLKKCFGGTPTATCEMIHPIVKIGPPPEKQRQKFQRGIIFPIRSPRTAIPAHLQDKAVKYHGTKGQIPVDSWRKQRDESTDLLYRWAEVLQTWKNMTEYEGIVLYLPYEHLLDPVKGPKITKDLARVLREAGFPAIESDEDAECVWYRAAKPRLQRAHRFHDVIIDFVPGYTESLKESMANKLVALSNVYPEDAVLKSLLTEYAEDFRSDPIVDEPWTNATGIRS